MINDVWLRQTGICVPSRTRLFCLKPINLGNPLVECLPSYLTRLGEAHFLSASKMMHEVCPEIRRADGVSTPSANWMTDDEFLAKELNSLTGRNDLQNLTFLSWRPLVSSIGLYRRYRARCLLCVREQQIDHQPLLWCLLPVKVCPVHRTSLSEACPFCTGKTRLRRTEIHLNSCSQCGKEFKHYKDCLPSIPDATKCDVWMAEQISTLLANPLEAHEQLPGFHSIMKDLVFREYQAPQYASASFNFHDSFFYRILSQKTTTLEKWCAMAWGMSLELRELLTQPPSTLRVKRRDPLYHRLYKSRIRHTIDSLQARLDDLLQSDTNKLLSHRRVAALLDVSPATLQRYCPETSNLLHERFKKGQKLAQSTRDQEWLRKIERVICYQQAHQGVRVSDHAIRKSLGTLGMPYNFSELVEQVRLKLRSKR